MTITRNNNLAPLMEEKKEEFIAFWLELVKAESPSARKECVDRVGQLVKTFAEKLGFSHRTVPFDKAGDGVVIEYNNGSHKEPILFAAHMDTVFAVGEFGEDPIRIEDGILYGPGVLDCKAGIVSGLLALYTLKTIGYADRPVKLVLSPDEEVSNLYSGQEGRDFLLNEAKGAFCAFSLECGYPDKFTTYRFGVARYEMSIRGVPAHAGVFYDKGRSAIKEAAHKIIDIEGQSEIERLTFNCGTIEGGTVTNVVPEHCRFSIDVRYKDNAAFEQAEAILQKAEQTVHVEDTEGILDRFSFRPSTLFTEGTQTLADLYASCHKAVCGKEIAQTSSRGGSDAANISQAGIPVIDSIGPIGGKFHTHDEWADLATLVPRTDILLHTLLNLPESF
ncbi:MAG: M20 family metallopeptidase [Ruminococcaceae bacterium]|nr:M20 family metallopeptidase [Oscillospiraceae bacterium]